MRATLALIALAACGQTQSNPGDVSPDAPPATSDAGVDDPGDDATPTDNDPTAGVDWYLWPEQQTVGYSDWGADLTDIVRHLPEDYGWQYWSQDSVRTGHETTHGIHSHLREHEAPATGGPWNVFYVLDNQAAFVKEPTMRKTDIREHVPMILRGPRYDVYLVRQPEWDARPLYVYDEWIANTNGAEVGIDQVQHQLYDGEWQDAVMGPLELTVYAIATAKAVSVKDPAYFASNRQFRRFTAWHIQRAMTVFEAGRTLDAFAWERQEMYLESFRTDPSAESLRAFARQTWGASFTQTVLGF